MPEHTPEHEPQPQMRPNAERRASNAAAVHPAAHHRQRAAHHLYQAARLLDLSVQDHAKAAHATAAERVKEAHGHIGEANANLDEADRLHRSYEQQR